MGKSIGLIYHFGANVLSKLLPVLLGVFLSRIYGESFYALFVEYLAVCALVTTIATVGFGQQLIIADYPTDRKNISFAISFFLLMVLVCVFWLLGFYERNVFFGVVFNVGTGITLLTVALLNGKRKFKSVFWFWLILFLIQMMGAGLVYLLELDVVFVFNNFAILYLIMAVVFFFFHDGKNIVLAACSRFVDVKPILSDAAKIAFFSSAIILGHSLIFKIINGSVSEKAVFSLGYQLFSLVTFIPTVLGSYVVPVISSGSWLNKYKPMMKALILQVAYGIIVLPIMLAVLLFYEYLLGLYKIKIEARSFSILFFIMLAALIFAVSTGTGHMNTVLKRFKTLSFASLIWLFVLGACVLFKYLITGGFQLTAYECAVGLVLSYLSYFLFFMIDFYMYIRKN